MDYLILAFAPNYWWFLLGRVIAGITGASFTTASAYIADISTPENRSKNFGMIGAAFGIGFIFGPFLGGVLGQYGVKIPFYAAAALSFANLPMATSSSLNHYQWKTDVNLILNVLIPGVH